MAVRSAELGKECGHLGGDAVVGRVAEAAEMSVVYLTGWFVGAILYGHTHLTVCVAERHALKHETVDILYREYVIVTRIIKYAILHRDMLKHKVGHIETFNQLSRSWEHDILHQLKIAVVAQGEIGGEDGEFIGKRLQTVAFATHDFEYIGIFLMGHDA